MLTLSLTFPLDHFFFLDVLDALARMAAFFGGILTVEWTR